MNSKLQRKLSFFLIIGILIFGISSLYKDQANAPSDLSFKIIDGRKLSLEQLRGRVLLIDFWATSCPSCLYEMPALAEVYNEHSREDFEIIAVAMPYDSPDLVLKAAKDLNILFPIALDIDGKIVAAFGGIPATPTHFIISPEGKVTERIIGAINSDKLRAKVKAMLLQTKKSNNII